MQSAQNTELEARWHDAEHTVMLLIFPANWAWDWEKFRAQYVGIIAQMDSEDHPVGIVWLNEQNKNSRMLLSEFGSQMRTMPTAKKFTGSVVVTENRFLMSMVGVYNRIFARGKTPVRVAGSLDSAIKIVMEQNKRALVAPV